MSTMSFDTDSSHYDFAPPANQCAACFAPNETPLTLFAGVAGIQYGTAVPGVDAPPANGLWPLVAIGPCVWFLAQDGYNLQYRPAMPNSHMQIAKAGEFFHFAKLLVGQCHTIFENLMQNPAVDPYYGGYVSIVNPKTMEGNSILEVLALLNISPTGDPWCNPRPIDDTQTAYAIYDPQDATRIHIAHDNP